LDTIHSVVAEGITVSHIEISTEEQCLIDWIESDNLNELMSFLSN
jgi:hypothetical protein